MNLQLHQVDDRSPSRAAGALEAVLSVKSLNDNIVPPTINHEEGDNDPEIDYNLNFTFNEAQPVKSTPFSRTRSVSEVITLQ